MFTDRQNGAKGKDNQSPYCSERVRQLYEVKKRRRDKNLANHFNGRNISASFNDAKLVVL